jgi:RNA polymerase sigma-70 factor (ECF subfamily)
MSRPADEDRALVHRARQGDFNAFEPLVNKYERRVYDLALRILRRQHDAEEAVQQTFLNVIEKLDTFREEASFYTWLMRIATNQALAMLRKRKVRAAVALSDGSRDDDDGQLPHPQYIAAWKETPEEIASRRETRQILDETLEELDEKYRLVFLLRDVEGLSTQETADVLQISVSNVKVRLLRARLMLRERLTRRFGDEASRMFPGHDH